MNRVKFIADIGSNHNQSIDRIKWIMAEAKQAGCWAVKFQLFKASDIYHKSKTKELLALKENELPAEFIKLIHQYCIEYDLKFGCTPFSFQAVSLLEHYVNFFKISSYEICRTDLIKEAARIGKPIFISTGYADNIEIEAAIEACLEVGNKNIILFHCIPEYPADINELSLDNIYDLAIKFPECRYGYSDHSRDSAAFCSAIGYPINYIEFHIDASDEKGNENKSANHCWTKLHLKNTIDLVRKIEKSRDIIFHSKYDAIRAQRADKLDGLRPNKLMR